MPHTIKLTTYKRYNMHHMHHKHESFMTKLCGMFKLWHYRCNIRKKRKNNQYNTHFATYTYKNLTD